MGIQRGSFERVLAVKSAPQPVRINASIPDIGAPLAAGAMAMGAFSKFLGKLSDIGTDYTRRFNQNEAALDAANGEVADAKAAYDNSVKELDAANGDTYSLDTPNYSTEEDRERIGLAQLNVDKTKAGLDAALRKQAAAQDRMNRTGFFGWIGTPHPDTGMSYEGENGELKTDSDGITTLGRMFKGTLKTSENAKKAYGDPVGVLLK